MQLTNAKKSTQERTMTKWLRYGIWLQGEERRLIIRYVHTVRIVWGYMVSLINRFVYLISQVKADNSMNVLLTCTTNPSDLQHHQKLRSWDIPSASVRSYVHFTRFHYKKDTFNHNHISFWVPNDTLPSNYYTVCRIDLILTYDYLIAYKRSVPKGHTTASNLST